MKTYRIYKVDNYSKKTTLLYANPDKDITQNLYYTLKCSNCDADVDYRIEKENCENI